jgi:hypothetical protein
MKYTKSTSTCLQKADEDEPIFVLRAQDVFAPGVVRQWAYRVSTEIGKDHPKVKDALEVAKAMEKWQNKKGSKIPD